MGMMSRAISQSIEFFMALGYDECTSSMATAWLVALACLIDIWIAAEIFMP